MTKKLSSLWWHPSFSNARLTEKIELYISPNVIQFNSTNRAPYSACCSDSAGCGCVGGASAARSVSQPRQLSLPAQPAEERQTGRAGEINPASSAGRCVGSHFFTAPPRIRPTQQNQTKTYQNYVTIFYSARRNFQPDLSSYSAL